jgi:hypothetical protein
MKNPARTASIATTGTATPTPVATVWLLFGEEVFVGVLLEMLVAALLEEEVGDVEVIVGLDSATPVDWGMLTAPAGTSTTLLAVEFRLDCAIPRRVLVRS